MDDDIFLETLNMDPLNMLDVDTRFSLMCESAQSEFQQFLETTAEGATSKNIIKRIWVFIKKIFKLIKNGVTRLINYIKTLIKRKSKSVDQIMSEIGIKGKKCDESEINVDIPSNPSSEVNMNKSVDVPFKTLKTKINEDGTVTVSTRSSTRLFHFNSGKVPGHKVVSPAHAIGVFKFINNPGLIYILIEISEELNKCVTDNDFSTFNKLLRELSIKIDNAYYDKSGTFTIKSLIDFQTKLNLIAKNIEIIDDNNIDFQNIDQVTLHNLNSLGGYASSLQMGINTISATFKGIYTIDKPYIDSISDVNKLAEFIDRCISSGVPSKYISYNAYLISSATLRGNGKHGDKNAPCWGQSRVVFFPSSDSNVVYKIALSGFGMRSNKSETWISNEFVKHEDSNLIAKIIDHSDNLAILTAERVSTKKSINSTDLMLLKAELRAWCKKYNIPFVIDYDIHKGNVGRYNNHWVVIDYGNILRK